MANEHPNLVVGLFAILVAFGGQLSPFIWIEVSGIAIGLTDLLAIAALLAAGNQLGKKGRHKISEKLGLTASFGAARLLLLALLLIFATVGGLVIFGVQETMNEARPWFYLVAWVIWSSVADPEKSTSLLRVYAVTSILCIGLAGSLKIWAFGLGSISTVIILQDGSIEDSRPVNAVQAMILVLAATFLSITGWSISGLFKSLLVSTAVIFILLGQNRSVWAAGFVVIACVVLFRQRGEKRNRRRISSFLALGSIAFVIVLQVFDNVLPRLQESSSNFTTLDARFEGWSALVQGSFEGGWSSVLFGQPMGSGWGRLQGGFWVEYSPHNWYVSVYLRAGLLGLSLVLTLMAIALRIAIRNYDPLLLSFVLGLATFSLAYSMDFTLIPFLVAQLLMTQSRINEARAGAPN